jgi:putative lipoic acid-binding regulatory protein
VRVQTFDGRRPEISYPCSWTYRVICTDEDVLRNDIQRLVESAEHSLSRIGASASGRYQRLELIVKVKDEEHRNRVFKALGSFAGVRFVL